MKPLLSLAVVLVLSASGCAEEPLPLPFTEGWVAKVNGDPILARDVIHQLGDRIEGMRNACPDPVQFRKALEIEFDHALFRMALDRVVEQLAKKAGIEVSKDEVEAELNEEIKREADGDREKFKEQIAQKGFTITAYSEVIRSQILGDRMLGGTIDRSALFVRPEEVIEYFKANPVEFTKPERVRPRILLILGKAPGEAEKILRYAEGLKRQVDSGADFAGMEKWISAEMEREAPVDLSWRERGDLDPALVQPVFDAPVGALVGPLQGSPVRGLPAVYLVKVEGHEQAASISFEESQTEISAKLRREKVRKEISRANHRLLKKSVVEFRVEACRQWYEEQREDEDER